MSCTLIYLHKYLCHRVADLVERALNQEPQGRESYCSSEGAMDRVDEQGTWDDVNNKEHKMNETGLQWIHLKHLHVSKEASLKCLHIKTHSVGCKHKEL